MKIYLNVTLNEKNMDKKILYEIAKRVPKPIRKLIKKIYNPIIPGINKLNYGEDCFPEASELMCNKLEKVISLKGDIIEFGCYKCGTTIKLAKKLKSLGSNKKIYALDTFSGLPKETKNKDNMPKLYKKAMDKNNLNKIKKILIKNKVDKNIVLIKGLFKDSMPKLKEKKFCFAFVDGDLYQSTKEALEFLIPRMNIGGIIFIDDYNSKSWVGVKKAVLELLHEKEIIQDKRVYWIKK